jgi:hypothetical protein
MAHWYRGVLHPWKVCMGWVGFWETFPTYKDMLDLVVLCGFQEKCEMFDVSSFAGGRDIITR